MAIAVISPDGRSQPSDEVTRKWRERIKQAQEDRRRYEPVWQQARAFASGKHWLKWSRSQRRLVLPRNSAGRERYSVEEIGQYRLTAVGELSHDDTMPTLLFRQGEIDSQEMARQINDALAYAWDEELDADMRLLDLKFNLVDLGTAAIRCRYDPNAGRISGHLPTGMDGRMVADPEVEASLEKTGQMPDGRLPRYQTQHEGLIRLELGVPENLLVPPGIEYQHDFPWEIWQRPVAIDDLVREYGKVAEGLKEEALSALQMLGSRELAETEGDPETDTGQPGRLREQVLVYSCFERPTVKNPDGEMVVLAHSRDLRPMMRPDKLPYERPDGTRASGIVYFHYSRVPGRFWGRGLIEVLKDPQRMVDRRRTQMSETIDRGQPVAFVQKGSIDVSKVSGQPVSYVEVEQNAPLPVFHPGVPPGQWMQAEVDSCREDMARASGIQAVSLGENPTNVGTYSQLALLRESDQIKRLPAIKRFQAGTAEMVEYVVYDMRTYWGREKQLTLAGEVEGMLQSFEFDSTRIPPFFKVQVAKGAAKPLTQGAKLQLITDIAQYSLNARQPLPNRWYFESMTAGEPLPLSDEPSDDQLDKARYENVLIARGQPVEVAYFDPGIVHVPEHRSLQIQAQLSGRTDIADAVEQHIQEHLQMERLKAAQPPEPPPGGGAAAPDQPAQPQPPAAQPALEPGRPAPVGPADLLAASGWPGSPAGPPAVG